MKKELSFKRNLHRFLSLVMLSSLFILFSSCNSPTKLKKGVILGKVSLFGEEDYSGITVSVYNADVVPEEIVAAKNKYPNLAFEIDDSIWFDHRQLTALATDTTDAAGKFSFNKLPYGKYIIVYYKEGWGYNYLFEILLETENYNLSVENEIILYPEEEVSGYINEEYEFEPGKCYVIRNDVIFGEQSHLIFRDNSRILLGRNVKIDTYGTVDCPEGSERAYITSYSGLYSDETVDMERGEGVNALASENEWRNLSFSYLQNAFSSTISNASFRNLSFLRCYFGMLNKHCENVEIKNCLFAKNEFLNTAAYNSYMVLGQTFSDNILYENYTGVLNRITTNSKIKNNKFSNNEIGFLNKLESKCVIENNQILSSKIGIENSGGSDLDILDNHIEARIAIKTDNDARIYSTPEKGLTKANYNNILGQKYAVESLAAFITPEGPFPLDFSNNYWGTTDISRIDDLIVDYQELGLENVYGYMRTVIEYLPIKRSLIKDAGIQG